MSFVVRDPVTVFDPTWPNGGKEREMYPVVHEENSEGSWIALVPDKYNAEWVANALNERLEEVMH